MQHVFRLFAVGGWLSLNVECARFRIIYARILKLLRFGALVVTTLDFQLVIAESVVECDLGLAEWLSG